ncbi:MAG TPA: hypothetical protein VH482_34280 [Thermomicrobiales bacterium]
MLIAPSRGSTKTSAGIRQGIPAQAIRSGRIGASIAAHRFGWFETMTSIPGATAATTSR